MAEHSPVRGPLTGLRVLVTRPEGQAASLTHLLTQDGAIPVEVPLISIRPCDDAHGVIQRTLESLPDYHWLVFTSVNGVQVFFHRLSRLGLTPEALHKHSIAAIGPATAQSLRDHGIDVDLVPAEHSTAGMVQAMQRFDLQAKRILLPRASEGSPNLPPSLEAFGAQVDDLSLYRTEIRQDAATRLLEGFRRGLDAATFTSPSTVRAMVTVLAGHVELLTPVVLACIGPVTANAARQAGLAVHVVASEYTVTGLVQALREHYSHGRT